MDNTNIAQYKLFAMRLFGLMQGHGYRFMYDWEPEIFISVSDDESIIIKDEMESKGRWLCQFPDIPTVEIADLYLRDRVNFKPSKGVVLPDDYNVWDSSYFQRGAYYAIHEYGDPCWVIVAEAQNKNGEQESKSFKLSDYEFGELLAEARYGPRQPG